MRRFAEIAAVGAVAAAVALTGCGGSSHSSSQGGSAASGTTSSAASGSGGGSASGSPIVIGSAAPLSNPAFSLPQLKTSMQAAIDAVNASGGVAGHPLKLDFCDTNYNPNGELACARQFVSAKVSAVVTPIFLADQSGREDVLLGAAHIPIFGSEGLSPAELNSPDAFPLSSGIPGWDAGAIDDLIRHGATKIALLGDTNPASEFSSKDAAGMMATAGLKPVQSVIGDPQSDPTFSSSAAKVTAGGVNGVYITSSPVDVAKQITALRQSGYKGQIATIGAKLPQQSIDALGSAGNGVLMVSQLRFSSDTSNPGVAAYVAGMKKYAASTGLDDTTIFAWSAIQIFAKFAATLHSYSAPAVLAGLEKIKTPIDVGSAPPFSVMGKVSPVPEFKRILNPYVSYGTIEHAKVVPAKTGFVDPFKSLAADKK